MLNSAPVLILVHPGSMFGSMADRFGKTEALYARIEVAEQLEKWNGPIVIVDGFLSDEISVYDRLGRVINDVVAKGAIRIDGCDDSGMLEDVGARLNEILPLAGRKSFITGAWYFEDGSAGCVNSVASQVEKLGAAAIILDTAVKDPDGCLMKSRMSGCC